MTYTQIYQQSRRLLTHETADFDLSQLFHAHFKDCVGLSRPEAEVPPDDAFVFQRKVKRLLEGYPLQYLLGEWEFYSVPLRVGEGVLIPRPDTETVVDKALELASAMEAPVIADLCSGSGAIALALAKNLPAARVYAVELSPDALPYLRTNVAASGCADRIHIIEGDVLAPLRLPPLDILVSNPPYLTKKEMGKLPPQVVHEPAMALDGGEDGLTFYRAIVERALPMLHPGGALLFELGWRQADDVDLLMQMAGFVNVRTRKDLNGIERCIFGFRPRPPAEEEPEQLVMPGVLEDANHPL